MGRKRNDKIVNELYAMYVDGMSLSQIADRTGRKRQSVWCAFNRRGLKMRKKPPLEKRIFQGNKYTMKPSGYWARTDGSRELMHRDVWAHHFGEIEQGFQIHHKDGDRSNNLIENLAKVERSEHSRAHNKARMSLHVCPGCGCNLISI